MRKRFMILGMLGFSFFILTPHAAQPASQDDSAKEAIQISINAGVDYLKRVHTNIGTWPYLGQSGPAMDQVIGCTALCGLALMECGVPVNDNHITAAAKIVRPAASNPRFNFNYSVCLCLLFLDRLHRNEEKKPAADVNAILRLAQLIVNGQSTDGGWTYNLAPGSASDNSNTQFAVVALWVARKYKPGGAIDRALNQADKKFRRSQNINGGWGYDATGSNAQDTPRGTMTCAGLLGIALNAGAKRRSSEAAFRGPDGSGSTDTVYNALETDPQVIKGKAYLETVFQQYLGPQSIHGHASYFFWSLERVATLYRWKKLDDAKTIDWYELGSQYLVRRQNKQTGEWNIDTTCGPEVDTAFVLLFLSKSNLLGSLQEAVFTNPGDGSITGTLPQPREKKPATPQNHEQHARELATKALTALPAERANLLNELRDAPLSKDGAVYTAALIDLINKIDSKTGKELARDALAERLQRLPTKSLLPLLNDDNRELRLAATKAARDTKHNKELESVTHLIGLLEDKDSEVATAALDSLKAISQQDFGKSINRWNRWLETTKPKKP